MRRALLAIWLVATALPLAAQTPDEFTNLQILPKDISKPELVGMMRGFAGALGVRCSYCHVGPDNLVGMDFATDEKPTKHTARKMIKMVRAINGELLAGIETSSGTKVAVGCNTCHRGVVSPQQIEDVVAAVIDSDGYEAGVAKYKELRDSYYGRAAYDFGPPPLNTLAERLFRQGRQDEAIVLTKMNNELHPDYPWSRSLLGRFHMARGETAEAIAAFEEALAFEPDNEWVKAQLAKLKQPAASGEKEGREKEGGKKEGGKKEQ